MRGLALLAILVSALAAPGAAERLTADQVARRIRDRDTGRDSRAALQMKLFDRRGRVRDRALSLLTLKGKAGAGDRLLIRFTYPNDIRGTGFLVWEHPQGEDERFLFLPSLGRVRRIAGSEAQDSFVGSDFSYEDIGGREFDEYTYAFAGADAENVSWTGPDGRPRAAYRLESKRKNDSVEFPRAISLVLKDSFLVVQADILNRRGEKQKLFAVQRLDTVQGIWTVLASTMTNDLEKTRTELSVEKIEYNVGLKEDAFTRRELEAAIK
jgi:hypothetical protein